MLVLLYSIDSSLVHHSMISPGCVASRMQDCSRHGRVLRAIGGAAHSAHVSAASGLILGDDLFFSSVFARPAHRHRSGRCFTISKTRSWRWTRRPSRRGCAHQLHRRGYACFQPPVNKLMSALLSVRCTASDTVSRDTIYLSHERLAFKRSVTVEHAAHNMADVGRAYMRPPTATYLSLSATTWASAGRVPGKSPSSHTMALPIRPSHHPARRPRCTHPRVP